MDICAGEMSGFGPDGCHWAYLRRHENDRISISRLNLKHGGMARVRLHPFCWLDSASPTSHGVNARDIELGSKMQLLLVVHRFAGDLLACRILA